MLKNIKASVAFILYQNKSTNIKNIYFVKKKINTI